MTVARTIAVACTSSIRPVKWKVNPILSLFTGDWQLTSAWTKTLNIGKHIEYLFSETA